MVSLFLPTPPNPIHPLKPPRPPHPTLHISRLPPSNSLSPHFTVTALTSLTLTLSSLPPIPPPAHLTSSPPPTPLSISTNPLSTSTFPTPIAVVGVAHAPLHQYPPPPPPSRLHPSQNQPQQQLSEDARGELLLAARLITALLLGVMVGIEPRAMALNLGVRSITLIAVTAAMCTVATTFTLGIHTGFMGWMAAMPFAMVVSTGFVTAAVVWIAANLRKKHVHQLSAMSVLVGVVVIMGAACGAGLSLLGAVAYLTAVAVMRGSERNQQAFAVRELRVSDEKDGMDPMVLRIGGGQGGGTRVVEVGTQVWQDSMAQGRRTDDALQEEER